MSSNSSSPETSPCTFRQKLIGYLTTTSHVSAPFITTFLLIHLTAPLAANVGGSDLSSKVMLLGREYYQTALTEPLLVIGPIAVHSLSGILKRGLFSYRQLSSSQPQSKSFLSSLRSRLPTVPLTPLTLSAYPLFMLYAIHFQTHRALPMTPTPPISSLGPSEIDFGFVQYALQQWPVRSFIAYGLLVGCAVVHAAVGTRVLMRKWGGAGMKLTKKGKNVMLAVMLGISIPVISGLVVLYREPMFMFEHMASRVRSVFELSFPYRY